MITHGLCFDFENSYAKVNNVKSFGFLWEFIWIKTTSRKLKTYAVVVVVIIVRAYN